MNLILHTPNFLWRKGSVSSIFFICIFFFSGHFTIRGQEKYDDFVQKYNLKDQCFFPKEDVPLSYVNNLKRDGREVNQLMLDLNSVTTGVNHDIQFMPTTSTVISTSNMPELYTHDGFFKNIEIRFTGVLDAGELAVITRGSGYDVYYFNETFVLREYNIGTTRIKVKQTGTSFLIEEVNGELLSNDVFLTFMSMFLYGNLTQEYTNGIRVMNVTIEDSIGNTISADSLLRIFTDEPLAVDDENTINADAINAITGNIIQNDDGIGLIVSEVAVYQEKVGESYQTLYGTLIVDSDGKYIYAIDPDNNIVKGLREGEFIEDIISYTISDAIGITDYGMLTIFIQGVNEAPIAVDNVKTITVGTNATVTGNVLLDDDGLGQDFADLPLSYLRWENEFTNGQAVGGTSKDIDEVNVSFTTLDPSGIGVLGQNQVVNGTGTNGGHTGYLLYYINGDDIYGEDTQLIIDFDTPVSNVGFTIVDIDYSQGTRWQDQMTIEGTQNTTSVPFEYTTTGGVMTIDDHIFYGVGDAIPSDATGNVNVIFKEPITQLKLSYNYGANVTAENPASQIAGISDIYWQTNNKMRVVKVNDEIDLVGQMITTTYGMLTIYADGNYTYSVDENNLIIANLPLGTTLIDRVSYTLTDGMDNSVNIATAFLHINIEGTMVADEEEDETEIEEEDENEIVEQEDLIIYSGITPDGDGMNDEFRIIGLDKYPNNRLRIYSRWKALVFDTTGYEQTNTGYFKGTANRKVTTLKTEELPVGTYFYMLEYEKESGNQKTKTGFLYVNR